MLDVYTRLRKLAKTNEYQSLYSLCKEIHSIKLFENEGNFTPIQINFLRYLNFYSNLMTDIYIGDVGEVVLENEVYEDSYMLFRSKKDKQINKVPVQNKDEVKAATSSRWIFKDPSKK